MSFNTYLQTDKNLVKNNAGGQSYQIDPLKQLERFLILGSDAGTYYVKSQDLTLENAKNAQTALDRYGVQAVELIVNVGKSNRAPKHDPALFALAMAASHTDPAVRKYALDHLNEVVRTGTHLFHFVAYVNQMRGWGRALRSAVANWYTEKESKSLAYQVMKYKQRDGWSHRDVLRLSHPIATDPDMNMVFHFVTQGTLNKTDSDVAEWMDAAIRVTQETDVAEIVRLIRQYNLPREVVPTSAMNDPRVWEALLPGMGMTALLRNIRNMSKDGFLVQGSDAVRDVVNKISDTNALRKGRIHPAQVFLAMKAAGVSYEGRSYDYYYSRQSPETVDVPKPVKDALEGAFYEAFDNVQPTGKRIMLALDVSGSMSAPVLGGQGSCREWSALMAMVTARSEKFSEMYAFSTTFEDFPVSKNDSIGTVIQRMSRMPFGGTDCALPMTTAQKEGMNFDAFCVYTDSETWANRITPANALRNYRKSSGIHDAKMVVTAMAGTGYSIADPNDIGMMDVVGMDTSAPAVISDFIRG